MNTQQSVPLALVDAVDRYFRSYETHCTAPNRDTLFNLLNAAHSLNDKLRKYGGTDILSIPEFVALKALRNFFHHEDELVSQARSIAAMDIPPISTDLAYLCLVPTSVVEKAISGIPPKWRTRDEPIVRGVLKWYGRVVNINPCIFNLSVHIYEKILRLDLPIDSSALAAFRNSYDFENQNGLSHIISGDIECHLGAVNEVLEKAFADVLRKDGR